MVFGLRFYGARFAWSLNPTGSNLTFALPVATCGGRSKQVSRCRDQNCSINPKPLVYKQ